MYLDFYGFNQKPFALQPDPEFLFLSKRHREATDALSYSLMNAAPVVVITGEIGSGKTTLIRYFLNTLDRNTQVGLISNTHSNFTNILPWVLSAFGLDYRGRDDVECYDLFVDFLIAQYAQGKKTILIVDEAQNLDAALIEQLRLLTNINSEKDQLLQLILVGQPQLQDVLRHPDLVQFVQRISLHYHLEPLLLGEIQNYIRHRLRIAKGKISTFDASAIGLVAFHSRGIPRIINSLCDMALVYGYAGKKERIDGTVVRELLNDRVNNSILFQETMTDGKVESLV